ncbi:LuxR C-terminal-related transcriptional regulator [Filimonas lacunae]|nr:LuxR C-terminal-related transcriptional regulator [Filimonas lacunae]BAV06218.1 two-component transcriptional regulator, LuxR family [Filimonas lacunae]
MKKKTPDVFQDIQQIQPVITIDELKQAILKGDISKVDNIMALFNARIDAIPQFAVGTYTWYVANKLSIGNMGGMSEHFTGHPPGYWLNKNPEEYLQLLHPEDAPYVMSYVKLIYEFLVAMPRDKKHFIRPQLYFRMRNPYAPDNYRWVMFQYIDWEYATDGMIACILHLVTDITHLKNDSAVRMTILDSSMESNQLFFSNVPQDSVGELSNITVCRLSGRELDVLRLMAQGLSSKQIASELKIAKNTVDNHRQNLLKKTNTSSSSEAVAYALKNGLF